VPILFLGRFLIAPPHIQFVHLLGNSPEKEIKKLLNNKTRKFNSLNIRNNSCSQRIKASVDDPTPST
jgi:hypothetical protein